MSNKNEKAARRLAALNAPVAQLPTGADARRFHPQRNLLLCRSRMETVSRGGIHLPQNRAIAVPIGEVLDVGADVKGYSKGELILFATSAALAIDGDLFVLEDSKVLCKVDPPGVIVS